MSQEVEVRTYYDDAEEQLKEVFTLKAAGSKVLHGPYAAFYKDGTPKTSGQYFNNVSTGVWEFYYLSGELRMRGSLVEGRNEGPWEYFFENGRKSMEGDIYNGKREGYWKMFYQNGSIKSEGSFKAGKRQGEWKFYFEMGGLQASANYVEDFGDYEEYYPSGTVKMRGTKQSGQKTGVWEYYYEDGTIKGKGDFENSLKSGVWQYYSEEGVLITEGTYTKDQPDGLWIEYHDDGSVSSRGNYQKGQKHGSWNLFYEDGSARGEGLFVNGTGEYREYYRNGQVRVKGTLLNGKNHGRWEYFYENGKQEGICEFEHGEGVYIGTYSDGNVKMTGKIRNNERVGIWELYKEDGTIAGYYKPYFENGNTSLWLAKDSDEQLAFKSNRKVGSYKYKRKRFNHFDAKVNEFRAVIIGYNPIAPVLGSFPLGIEYYHQERLGHELLINYLRNPFFRSHSTLALGENFSTGWEVALRQKFYNKERRTGEPYFGHEVRYSSTDHRVRVPDITDPAIVNELSQVETKYEYSLFVGTRYFTNPKEGGVTFDAYIGAGLGYRGYTTNFDPTADNQQYFSELPSSNLAVAFRLGLNMGFAIRVKK